MSYNPPAAMHIAGGDASYKEGQASEGETGIY